MIKINVASKIKHSLISSDDGRDLFCTLLEEYISRVDDEIIDLDFSEVVIVTHAAWVGFVTASSDSQKLPWNRLELDVNFSGLTVADIKAISKAFSDPTPEERVKVTAQTNNAISTLTDKLTELFGSMGQK